MAIEVSQPMADTLDILRLEILLIDTTVHLQPAEVATRTVSAGWRPAVRHLML